MSESVTVDSQNMSQPAPSPSTPPTGAQASPLSPPSSGVAPDGPSIATQLQSRGATAVAADLNKLDALLMDLYDAMVHNDNSRLELLDPGYVDPLHGHVDRYRTNISFWSEDAQSVVTATAVRGTDPTSFTPSAAYSDAQAQAKLLIANPGTSLRGTGPSDSAAVNGAMAARAVSELRRVTSSLTYPIATALYCAAAYDDVSRHIPGAATRDPQYNLAAPTSDIPVTQVAYMTQFEYAEYRAGGNDIAVVGDNWAEVPCVFLPSIMATPQIATAMAVCCSERNQPLWTRNASVGGVDHVIRTHPIRVIPEQTPFYNEDRIICVVLDDPRRAYTLTADEPRIDECRAETIRRDDWSEVLAYLCQHATRAEKMGALLLFGAQHTDCYVFGATANLWTQPYQASIGIVATHWDSYLIRFSQPSMIVPDYDTSVIRPSSATFAGAAMFRLLREYLGMRFQADLQSLRQFQSTSFPGKYDQLKMLCGGWDAVMGRYDVFSGPTSHLTNTLSDPWTVLTPAYWFRGLSVEIPRLDSVLALKPINVNRTTWEFRHGSLFNGWSLQTAGRFLRLSLQAWSGGTKRMVGVATTVWAYNEVNPGGIEKIVYGVCGIDQGAYALNLSTAGPLLPVVLPAGPTYWAESPAFRDHGLCYSLRCADIASLQGKLHNPTLYTDLGQEAVPRGDYEQKDVASDSSFLAELIG